MDGEWTFSQEQLTDEYVAALCTDELSDEYLSSMDAICQAQDKDCKVINANEIKYYHESKPTRCRFLAGPSSKAISHDTQ
jgi:hypothetical protein